MEVKICHTCGLKCDAEEEGGIVTCDGCKTYFKSEGEAPADVKLAIQQRFAEVIE